MRIQLVAVCAALLAWPAFSAPPSQPQVTVGTPGLKLLQFDWQPVSGATTYLLKYKPNAASPFTDYGSPIFPPWVRAIFTIPVHTFDWATGRFRLLACNTSGCSQSPDIFVAHLMLDAIGYVKSSFTDVNDGFGNHVLLSRDGNTLIASAFDDDFDNSVPEAGAVYVFRRNGNTWRQEAFLKPPVTNTFQLFGVNFSQEGKPLGISADGSVIAVGAPGDVLWGVAGAGAVYIYKRAANGRWTSTHNIFLQPQQPGDRFGETVDLDDTGTLLKATTRNRSGPIGFGVGKTYLIRLLEAAWFEEASFFYETGLDCSSQMSGNGGTLLHSCGAFGSGRSVLRTHKKVEGVWTFMQEFPLSPWSHPPGLSGNGGRVAIAVRDNATGLDRVQVLSPFGNQWLTEAYIDPPPGLVTDQRGWGTSLAFNRNGTMLAIGDSTTPNAGAGVMDSVQPPANPQRHEGAVFIYQRGESGWTFVKMAKAPNPGDLDLFGRDITLSGNGLTLAVGAMGEDSAARGIDGNQADNSTETAGAIYLY